tara:strand:+ start:244 stop:528 length:285 start_codon:yes stop_codon:yes gene_type:complete
MRFVTFGIFLALFAGYLRGPSANDFNVRDTCGRLHSGFFSPKEAHKRLGLPKYIFAGRWEAEPKSFYDFTKLVQEITIENYCNKYTGVSDVHNN